MKELYDSLDEGLKSKFANIKLLCLDFDGTLTDGCVYISEDKLESIKADRTDGLGLEFVRKYTDIDVIILSRETNKVVAARASKLNIPCTQGLNDKISNFMEEVKKRKLDVSEVCFVGDDLNDIEVIQKAGLGIAVGSGFEQVKKVADYITKRNGGNGAVREVCELIMYAKGKHPYP
ncbi:HAD hydrolase family protein [Candidatus Woesearchaeota archaeon]|jgi:YrbI family 3-deoxy-D-manno-octulosonate 8-phosphate phosphatase|nr:HAD hydrolase family protein [Candidatus Woesearchaeota archaeon]MBT6045075.1 HAD hydrolase family protein [Candidatus Woesearchaeota archaeon]